MPAEQSEKAKQGKAPEKKSMIAVIRIRGNTGIKKEIERAMKLLRLHNQHACVVVEDSPSLRGMLQKVKDYVTYGPVSDETVKALAAKRGVPYKEEERHAWKKKKKRFLSVNGKKYEPLFRLSPPRGGFERGGIKRPFAKGGALGNRGEKINDLIKKML